MARLGREGRAAGYPALELYRRVSGSKTTRASSASSTGYTSIKLKCNGSSIQVFFNGSLTPTFDITDTSIVSGSYVGFNVDNVVSGCWVDNWTANDLAVAATGLPRRALSGPFYGSLRGSVQ
jgi:hypothetical protein